MYGDDTSIVRITCCVSDNPDRVRLPLVSYQLILSKLSWVITLQFEWSRAESRKDHTYPDLLFNFGVRIPELVKVLLTIQVIILVNPILRFLLNCVPSVWFASNLTISLCICGKLTSLIWTDAK